MAERARIVVLILSTVTLGLSISGCAEGTRLQFRPKTDQKQTMRVTFRQVIDHPSPAGGQDSNTHTWTFTVELGPLSIAPDGSVAIKAGILRAREEFSIASRGEVFHFDTAGAAHELNVTAGKFVAFLGESFTVVTSAQGGIIKLDTDAFYKAIAENRLKHENRAQQIQAEAEGGRRYKNSDVKDRRLLIQKDAEEAIRRTNEKYGSPEKRKQAYKEEAADFPFYGTVILRMLLNNLLAPLPPGPVQPGDHWSAPVLLHLEGPVELAGRYTFTGQQNGVGTIRAEARRNMDDLPLEAPPIPEAQRTKLAGNYQATIKVDPATGTLLSKEAVMEMKGTAPMPDARTGTLGASVPITAKATVTVEALP